MRLPTSATVPSVLLVLVTLVSASTANSPYDDSLSDSQSIDPLLDHELSSEFSPSSSLQARSVSNLQTFSQALGGAAAPPITNSGSPIRPFTVDGETFDDFATAATRTCNNQHNACADMVNNGTISNSAVTVQDCDDQQTRCEAAQATATLQNFQVLVSSDANFDYICDSNV